MFTPVDYHGFKKLDSRTVRVTCSSPFSTFPQALSGPNSWVVPVGFDPKQPVRTGPFRHASVTPGVQTTATRNPNYWQSGLPYVDSVTITEFADETSMLSAFQSGQLDMIAYLSAEGANSVAASGANVHYQEGGTMSAIVMNHSAAPFTDARSQGYAALRRPAANAGAPLCETWAAGK
jgi:peptide/nickel transport system substrate-binding protein